MESKRTGGPAFFKVGMSVRMIHDISEDGVCLILEMT